MESRSKYKTKPIDLTEECITENFCNLVLSDFSYYNFNWVNELEFILSKISIPRNILWRE